MNTPVARRQGMPSLFRLSPLLLLATLAPIASAQPASPLEPAAVRTDSLLYGTLFGGSGFEDLVIFEENGRIYCSALTTDSDGLPEVGAAQNTRGGTADGYLACFGPDGTQLWGRYYGGQGPEAITGAQLTDSTFIVTGYTFSNDLPGTEGGFQPAYGGIDDCFAAVFDAADGSLSAATYIGSEGSDGCNDVATGRKGIYLAGYASVGGPRLRYAVYLMSPALDRLRQDISGTDTTDIVGQTVTVMDLPWNDSDDEFLLTTAFTIGNAIPSTDGSSFQGGEDVLVQHLRVTDSTVVREYASYVGGPGIDNPTAARAYTYREGVHYDPFVATTLAMRSNSAGLETTGRAHNGGLDGLVQVSMFDRNGFTSSPARWYAGPSSLVNLALTARYDYVGTPVVGGFAEGDQPGNNAFVQTYSLGGALLGETRGGSLSFPSYCLSLSVRLDYTLCAGKTFGDVPTTPDAFQSNFGGGSDAMVQNWVPHVGFGRIINLTDRDGSFLVSGRVGEAFHRNEGAIRSGTASAEFALSPGAAYEFLADDGQGSAAEEMPAPGAGGLSVGYMLDDGAGLKLKIGLSARIFGDGSSLGLLNRLEEPVTLSAGADTRTIEPGAFGSVNLGDVDSVVTVEPASGPRRTYQIDPINQETGEPYRITGAVRLAFGSAQGKTGADFDLLLFDRLGRRVELLLATGTAADPGPAVPGTFALHPNYPNPFGPGTGPYPTTTIRYDVTRPGRARLRVFDALGRTVAVLVDRPLSPGAHHAVFKAADLPSGLYFYRLEVNGDAETRAMVLLR